MSNLAKALSAKAAFVQMKATLKDAGIDISDVKHITDLAPVLANILPEDMAKQAEALLNDESTLKALLEAFTGAADTGFLVSTIHRPTDFVYNMNLYE